MVEMLPVDAETFCTRQLSLSAMYRFPAPSTATDCGRNKNADVAGPPSPPWPLVAWALPATVYTSPAVMVIPNWVWLYAAISWIRLFHASAMYTSPAESNASPSGLNRPALIAGPPFPAVATCKPLPAYREMVSEEPTRRTRLLAWSAMYIELDPTQIPAG